MAIALLAVLGGCGKTWTQNDNVEGTVKLDGTKLANVMVEFVPDDPKIQGPSSSAMTDAEGHFKLMCDNGKSGAVLGKHNITVRRGRTETGAPTSPVAIPDAYGLAAQTPLQKEVTADQHTYDLDLTRNAAPRKP